MAGKGSKERPLDKPKYDSNFDEITWNREELPQTEVKIIKSKLGKTRRFTYK